MSSRDEGQWGVVDEEPEEDGQERERGVVPDLGRERAGPLAVGVWVACYLGFLYAFAPILGTAAVPAPSGEAVLAVPLAPVVGLLPPFPLAGAVYGALTGEGGLRGGVRTTGKLFVDGLSLAGEVLASLGGVGVLALSALAVLDWLGGGSTTPYTPANFLPLWAGCAVAVVAGALLHWLHLQVARTLGLEPRRATSHG